MSFAGDVKKELTMLEVHPEHAKAELAALIRMNGSLNIIDREFHLNIVTENAAIARRIFTLIKDTFDVQAELSVRKKMKLKKNNVYIVRLRNGSKLILSELGIFDGMLYSGSVPKEYKENRQKMKSYLRGAFLAGGSVNSPETSRYHLEIHSIYEEHNEDIRDMFEAFGLNPKVHARKSGGYIVYVKESEKIADFMALIGATNNMFRFEDVRIVRDMRNSVNRIVNCETANLNKTISAASKQIQNIELIDQEIGLTELPKKLYEVAVTRLEHPDVSLKELGELIPSGVISKSGVNHRLRKINKIAEELK
ncbi:MAG TPA: DNA-binding protein WhiA [Alloiococcus sp.]|nr:DNA-binding protein WhiA [Alloiococcus sp.]